jgi:hypothetical protein
MGSTEYHRGTTFTEAMKYELGDNLKVLAKAEGEPNFDQKVTWFAVEDKRDGTRFIMTALWQPQTERYGVTVKLVDESMGMYDYNVPDKVWAKVPDAPADSSEYAIEWRKAVAEFKARFPLAIRSDLTQGAWYLLSGSDPDPKWAVQYLGEQRSGRSMVKVFMFPPEGGWTPEVRSGRRFRLRRGEERHGRARRVDSPLAA